MTELIRIQARNGADGQANKGEYLSVHKAPASVIKLKQNVCDKVAALAVCLLFFRKPELACNAGDENLLNNDVAVVRSAATVVGIETVKSFLGPAKILYFPLDESVGTCNLNNILLSNQ